MDVDVALARQDPVAKLRRRRQRMALGEEIHPLHHLAVGLVDRAAQVADDDGLGRERRSRGKQQENREPHYSDASSTPKTRFFSSESSSRALAASSNSRFRAWVSIFFSSAFISRASCFSLIAS